MRALNRKLLRMLWSLRGQGAAIALVMAAGVATFIMALGTLDSLPLPQRQVYAEQRFAQVFADLKRAPLSLAERLAEVPGIGTLETRVVAPLNVRVPDYPDPITGLALSIPEGQQPHLNRLFLRSGRLPDAERDDQILISEAFAQAHGLNPDDLLALVINGRYRQLRISGVALSPEYIYQIRPGDMFPDYARYAVVWMNRRALAAAFGMEGAFNSLVASLSPGAGAEQVIGALDTLLAPHGGLGAFDRDAQMSHRYLAEELSQLRNMAHLLPLIFIGVAAFLLNVVTARLIRTQREQIAVLKAFGYSNLSVALHYLALILLVSLIGSITGVLIGTWLASALAQLYQEYFRFPWLNFHLRPSVVVIAIALSAGCAMAGTLSALRNAFRLPPAEAMRPEAPPRYRRALIERLGIRWFSQPVRMIARNLERQPFKSGLSVLGIAFAVGIMMLTGFQQGAISHMLDVQFRLSQKQDVTVTFTEPLSAQALHSLRALPGVYHVEGFRSAPATLRHGHLEYRSALQGLPDEGQLFTVLDSDLQPLQMAEEGVMLTDHLAALLNVRPGDLLEVQIQDGRRPILQLPVAGLVKEYLGVGAYVSQAYMARLLKERPSVNGAFLAVDHARIGELNRKLEQMPRVLGVTERSRNIAAFHELMDETMLVFMFFSLIMAGSIAFAVVYNNARIAFAERGRELASLRVLGFTRGETAFILLGELIALTLLALAPGFLIGAGMCWLLTQGMQTDIYRVPLILTPDTFAMAALVVLVATLLSAALIWRNLSRLDMVQALKAAE
jgi:putative ABC transport system permease protein